MSRARELCVDSAMAHGVDGITWAFAATDADKAGGRGLGFWAWKPRIILDFLTDTTGGLAHPEDGDVLIYSDAGVEFINNVNYIIDRMDQDIFLFGNNWEHAHWCKRDVIEAVYGESWLHNQLRDSFESEFNESLVWRRFGKQCQASVIFFRVSDYSRKFVAEWLKWCLHRTRFSEGVCIDEWRYLIDDSPSILPNHPEFREHRHDQAILTTLAYREGIKLHYWPAQYNDGAFSYEKLPEYANDDYPILFHHHRKRNHEWKSAA